MATLPGRMGHLALRVSNLARARTFYVEKLKMQVMIEMPDRILLNVNGLILALIGDDPHTAAGDHFDPYRVGLDHLALNVADEETLGELLIELNQAGVPNHGIETDTLTGAAYISFYDPDGIAWELYVTPTTRPTR